MTVIFSNPDTLERSQTPLENRMPVEERKLPVNECPHQTTFVEHQVIELTRMNVIELSKQNQSYLEKTKQKEAQEGTVPKFFELSWEDLEPTVDPETGETVYEVNSGKVDEQGNPNPEHALLNQHPLPADATIIVHNPNGTTVIYKTDSQGRVKSMEVKKLEIVPEEDRQRDSNQTKETKNVKDGKPDDHGGHLLGDLFGGCSEQINLVPMSPEINLSVFKKIENILKKALEEGKEVTNFKVEPIYEGDSARPVGFRVSYEIDGKPYTTVIPSN